MLQPSKPSRLLALGLLLALATGSALADGLRAYFDRSQVHEGDTLTLNIEKAGAGASGSPDLGPLAQDFDVLGTSNSTQIRIVNSVRSDTTDGCREKPPSRLIPLPSQKPLHAIRPAVGFDGFQQALVDGFPERAVVRQGKRVGRRLKPDRQHGQVAPRQ